MPPDKGKEKAVSDDTTPEGSEHDLSTHPRTMYHLQRQNKSADHLRSHSSHHHLTTRSDDKGILNEFLSKMDEIEKDSDEAAAEAKRRAEEAHVTR